LIKDKEEIEKYIYILSETLCRSDYWDEGQFNICKNIVDNNSNMKNLYESTQKKLETDIFNQMAKIRNIEAFQTALFCIRSKAKILMYKDNLHDWTERFKIVNYLFLFAVSTEIGNRTVLFCKDSNVVRKIIGLGYTFFCNLEFYNQTKCNIKEKIYEKFYARMEKVTNRIGDMHTYQIKQKDILLNLQKRNINEVKMKSRINVQLENFDKIKQALNNNRVISIANKNSPKDDLIILENNAFKCLQKELQVFIERFEAKKSKNPSDIECDFIFSYRNASYIFISKKIVFDTLEMFEKFFLMGQYENLFKYYYQVNIDQKNLSDYNKLMTYKIVDFLFINNYLLPLETRKDKLIVPRIEIEDYTLEKQRQLGDIDVLFYSSNTSILYVVEYKNYQMMITRENDVSAEISKVEREETIKKVLRRQACIEENIDYILEHLFKNRYNVKGIKSIILTTKPNFYFFQFPIENTDCEYMDWIEFEEKVIQKQF
jgi:hypothetical protein